jgi:hypothetical protein
MNYLSTVRSTQYRILLSSVWKDNEMKRTDDKTTFLICDDFIQLFQITYSKEMITFKGTLE